MLSPPSALAAIRSRRRPLSPPSTLAAVSLTRRGCSCRHRSLRCRSRRRRACRRRARRRHTHPVFQIPCESVHTVYYVRDRYEIPYLVSHISYPVSHPMYLVSHILYFKSHVGLFTPCTVCEVRDTVSCISHLVFCISGVECEIRSTGRFVLRISIRYVFGASGTRHTYLFFRYI